MMANFRVTVVRNTYASIDVEAGNEKAAEKLALEKLGEGEDPTDDDYEPGPWKILHGRPK
jgi:hypothetical protein